jgi:hypothetical protein
MILVEELDPFWVLVAVPYLQLEVDQFLVLMLMAYAAKIQAEAAAPQGQLERLEFVGMLELE